MMNRSIKWKIRLNLFKTYHHGSEFGCFINKLRKTISMNIIHNLDFCFLHDNYVFLKILQTIPFSILDDLLNNPL